MEGGQQEITNDHEFNSYDYSITSSVMPSERAQRIDGIRKDGDASQSNICYFGDKNDKSLYRKMKKRMLQTNIDRQIKRPIEFRIFYWLGFLFLFMQTLVYMGAAFRVDALTDLSHKAEE